MRRISIKMYLTFTIFLDEIYGFWRQSDKRMTSKRDVIFLVLGHVILHMLYIKKYVMGILHRIQALSCDKS